MTENNNENEFEKLKLSLAQALDAISMLQETSDNVQHDQKRILKIASTPAYQVIGYIRRLEKQLNMCRYAMTKAFEESGDIYYMNVKDSVEETFKDV